jgi:hypothetical protein
MSERTGVIRDNGVVVNVILWSDETDDQLLADKITDFEETTGMIPHPGIGWTWDQSHGYRPPQPYTSWTWNDDGYWQAPTAMPEEGGPYLWNEETQAWEPIQTPA